MLDHKPLFVPKDFKKNVLDSFMQGQDQLEKYIEIVKHWQNLLFSGKLHALTETQLDITFLNDFFGEILGYQHSGTHKWNLEVKPKTSQDSTRPDAVLGYLGLEKQANVRAVVELKGANIYLDNRIKNQQNTERKSAITQAFSYVSKFESKVSWVIVSNFQEIRLYSSTNSIRYELFELKTLLEGDNFAKFLYLLKKDQLFLENQESAIENLLAERQAEEDRITLEFYNQYNEIREILCYNLIRNNLNLNKFGILAATQKLLDRMVFIRFVSDNILENNILQKNIERAEGLQFEQKDKIWSVIRKLFQSFNKGYQIAIPTFNGGLFAFDSLLDNLLIIEDSQVKPLFDFMLKYDFQSELTVTILGHIFEQSISDLEYLRQKIETQNFESNQKINIQRKKDGIFYTPDHITKYIVEQSLGAYLEENKENLLKKYAIDSLDYWEEYRTVLQNLKIIDPACGSGAFLVAVFEFLFAEWKILLSEIKAKKERKAVKEFALGDISAREYWQIKKLIVENNLFGVDLNMESVEITKLSLWLLQANKLIALSDLSKNVKQGNSLISDPKISEWAFDWQQEFTNIFDKGGFDLVVGNPPYGAWFSAEMKNYLKQTYSNVHTRTIDSFNCFISKGFELLKEKGFLGFIVPSTLFFQNEFEKTRKLLVNTFCLKTAVNLGDGIFKDANVPTCIFNAQKRLGKENDSFEFADLRGKNQEEILRSNKKFTAPKSINLIKNAPSYIIGVSEDFIKIFQKIQAKSYLINEIALEMASGISTGADDVFRIANQQKPNFESDLLKPVLLGSEINSYQINYKKNWIIYTVKGTKIDDFPKIQTYLQKFEKRLSQKRETRNGILPYWCVNWARYPQLFEEAKILIRQTSDHIQATFDEKAFYVLNSILVLKLKPEFNLDYKFVLAILNSSLTQYLYKNISQEEGRTFAEVKPINIRKLFIPQVDAENQATLADLATKLLIYNESFNNKNRLLFLNNLQDEFYSSIKRSWTKKLENWYLLDWHECLEELLKIGIKINLKSRNEWKELFEETKIQCLFFKEKIEKTEKQINFLVFELYHLSQEEIKIVENGK